MFLLPELLNRAVQIKVCALAFDTYHLGMIRIEDISFLGLLVQSFMANQFTPNYQDHYCPYSHPCDEPLRCAQASALACFP